MTLHEKENYMKFYGCGFKTFSNILNADESVGFV